MIYRAGYKPILNKVEIERIPDRTMAGKIHLPDQVVEDAFMRGRVVATGDGYYHDSGRFIEPPVTEGDVVAFAENEKTMHQTMVNGHHIVPFDRVWGVLSE